MGAEAPTNLAPETDGSDGTDGCEAIQHVNTAGEAVVVDVVLTYDTQRNTVVDLARSHVNALWQQQVSRSKANGIFVVDQVLWIANSG